MSIVCIDAHNIMGINPGSPLSRGGRYVAIELDMDVAQRKEAVRQILGTLPDIEVADFLCSEYADLVQALERAL